MAVLNQRKNVSRQRTLRSMFECAFFGGGSLECRSQRIDVSGKELD